MTVGTAIGRPSLIERGGEKTALLRIRAHTKDEAPDVYMDFIIAGGFVNKAIDNVTPGSLVYLRAVLEHTPRASTALDPGASGFRGRVDNSGNLVVFEDEDY